MKHLFSLIAALFFMCGASAQDSAKWIRYSKISPNGEAIAFSYQGDIFTVPTVGGKATQITSNSAYDYSPVWSPDGATLAFASNREGSFDIYTVSTQGGAPYRVTYNSSGEVPEAFTADGKSILFNASLLEDAKYSFFPVYGELYSVPVKGGRTVLVANVPAYNIDINKAGTKLIYNDVKGFEDQWRKRHKSFEARDIWSYDLVTKEFKNITSREIEDRNPVYGDGEDTFYFLSEAEGSFNIFKSSLSAPEKSEKITNFENHPIRFLSRADNGTMAFTFDGELYSLIDGGEPTKLVVEVIKDQNTPKIIERTLRSGATDFAVSPDGKEIALIVRGDVFVTSVEFGTTKRITNTAQQERSVNFSPDGRSIVYAAERDGNWDIYTTSLVDENDKQFVYAHELKEEQITSSPKAEFQPAFSPDGKEIAFLSERTTLMVINLKSKKERIILDGKLNYSYADGDQWYEWSPDGNWFTVSYFENGGWNKEDIGIVKADGSKEIHNVTNSGYVERAPQWMMKGNAIIFGSDRNGYRSHGSWGSHTDVYVVLLNKATWDKFKMNKEELKLVELREKQDKERKEKEEDKKKDDKKSKKEKKSKDKKEDKKLPKLDIDFDNLDQRTVRLTTGSGFISGALLTNDGTKLYYINRSDDGYALWVQDIQKRSNSMVTKLNSMGSLIAGKDGKFIYMLSHKGLQKIDVASGKIKPISYSAEFELKVDEEREYIFNHAYQQVKDKFYDPTIHNIDWDYYKTQYSKFLPYIANDTDFAELLSEFLGELNASHTGARFYNNKYAKPTAALGAFYDNSHKGDGLLIEEIIDRGPLNSAKTKIKKGIIITAIDGNEIKKNTDYYRLLNGKSGKKIVLSLYNPKDKKSWKEEIKPISQEMESSLLYNRWVEGRRKLVEELSDGRIGYVHIKGMDSHSFRTIFSEILGKNRNKEAIVVDTRYNGGGWLHDDLITLLDGKKYAEFEPRGQHIGTDPIMKWTKPSIVVTNGNYSDAHGFPWVYREFEIGKIIGAPVPGTMTAVWWENQINKNIIFGIPQVGLVNNDGKYLENIQLEPDVKVYNDPNSATEGRDLQIEVAVKELLKELK